MPHEGVQQLEHGADGVALNLAFLDQGQLDVSGCISDLLHEVDKAELAKILWHAERGKSNQ